MFLFSNHFSPALFTYTQYLKPQTDYPLRGNEVRDRLYHEFSCIKAGSCIVILITLSALLKSNLPIDFPLITDASFYVIES